MTAPDVMFVDIGGVLLSNGWDRRGRRAAAETFDLDPEEMDERHHLTFDTYEEGKLTLDQYLDRTVFHRERSFSRDAFKRFMYDQSRANKDVIELVKAVKQRHRLRVVAISNEGRELTVHRVRTFHLAAFIDFFVSSCFVHMRKPDEDIYRLALDCAQADARSSVYIDDRPLFIEVARGLGMRGVVHAGTESTRRALSELGLDA
jgi:putative hydrolase of the HAD superfamily